MGLDQPAPHGSKSVLGQLAIGDVQARSDVASEIAVWIESWYSGVEDPTVLSIITPETVFHRKRLTLIKRPRIDFQAALQIFWVYSFRPAVSQFSLKRPARELQEGLIDIAAKPVGPGRPDHY